jgi:acetyl-CoA carboxylase biotin carboxylase subunit
MADMHGDVVHLGERDCSMQRRNQKIIEETPSPIMTDEIRERMGEDCVRLAKEVGYVGAGTIECLMDDHGHYYFMEMNTRIQVEHCITEESYGVDLVKEQIKVASGEPLSQYMHNAKRKYHAIECRINAEDPFNNFQPCPGKIDLYYAPGGRGIRVDSHAYSGYAVPPHYDSMIAKVIAMGTTRANAIARMSRALGEYMITGIKTTIPFQEAIMRDPDFVRGKYNTGFVAKIIESRVAEFTEK